MTSQPDGRTERGDRRARGDGLIWLLAGLVMILLGWLVGWSFVLLLGGFFALPGLVVLVMLRRDRVRRGVSSPNRSRE